MNNLKVVVTFLMGLVTISIGLVMYLGHPAGLIFWGIFLMVGAVANYTPERKKIPAPFAAPLRKVWDKCQSVKATHEEGSSPYDVAAATLLGMKLVLDALDLQIPGAK